MTESDLLINSDERCGSSAAEDENKETNENSNRNGKGTRKRAERRCALYKKHSCQAPAHRNYTTLACNNRSHRLYKKQMRINSVLLSMRRVSVAPTSELLDWRQRAEDARALCSSAVARMKGIIQAAAEQHSTKRIKADWSKVRRPSRRKKPKEKDRSKSADDIRMWNELCDSFDRGAKHREIENKIKSAIGLSHNPKEQKVNSRRRNRLSTKGRQYQERKNKSETNKNEPNIGGLSIDATKDTELAVGIMKQKKNGISSGRSPRSLSPSINVKVLALKSPLSPRTNTSMKTRFSNAILHKPDRSPSPSCRSLSPRICPLTPSCFQASCKSTCLETNKFLRPFTTSDFNNNIGLSNGPRQTFKSSSMINLPALLRTK